MEVSLIYPFGHNRSMALKKSQMLSLGTEAPGFRLEDVVSGEPVSLGDVSGKKALLVMFICNHCPYVVHLKDEIGPFTKEYLGKDVAIKVEGGNVMINDATVIITDIEASNGVIHVIDTVILPPADAPATLPESGGAPSYSGVLLLFALGALLVASGVVLRLRLARISQ